MGWFKKSPDGDLANMNPTSAGDATKASEATVAKRADPKAEVRVGPATPSELRGPELRGSESRGAGLRGPEIRGPEVRGPEVRGPEVRRRESRPPELRSSEVRGPEVRGSEVKVSEAPRAPDARAVEVAARGSILGPTLKFRGELSAQEDLIVQGSVEGSINHTQSLTIGTDGLMKGDIRARVIIVDGKVEGDLYATESISIRATAKVTGNVYAPRVGIADGAFFFGQVDMQSASRDSSSKTALNPATVDRVLSAT